MGKREGRSHWWLEPKEVIAEAEVLTDSEKHIRLSSGDYFMDGAASWRKRDNLTFQAEEWAGAQPIRPESSQVKFLIEGFHPDFSIHGYID